MRSLLRAPRFTATVVTIFALAAGAVTALASLLDALVLRPIALPGADRIVQVWTYYKSRNLNSLNTSIPKFRALEGEQRSFSSITASMQIPVVVGRDGDEPERVGAIVTTRSFVPTLGLTFAKGRNFTADEDVENGPHVAILTRKAWETRFGQRADILDVSVNLDGVATRIVGVLAERLPASMSDVEVLLPWPFTPTFLTRQQLEGGAGYLLVSARLKPGVTVDAATRDVASVATHYGAEHAGLLDGTSENYVHAWVDDESGPVRQSLFLLLAGAGLVLLIGCVNVATLFLNRWMTRRHEVALRLALGSSRRRIVFGLLAESLGCGVLACAIGGAGAAAFIRSGAGPLTDLLSGIPPVPLGRAFWLALAVSLGAMAATGLVPALQVTRIHIGPALRSGSRTVAGFAGTRRLRSGLIVSEVALSAALLIVATVFVASWRRLRDVPPGFSPAGVASVSLGLGGERYATIDAQRDVVRHALERLRATPGIVHAAAALGLPLGGGVGRFVYAVRGRPVPPLANRPVAYGNTVSDGFFQALGIPVRQGREFAESDDARRPAVCVINESFARRLFGDSGAVGHVLLRGQQADVAIEIVGVVGDVRSLGLDAPVPETMYLPMGQSASGALTLVASTSGAPEALAPMLKRTIHDLDPTIAPFGYTTMDAQVSTSLGVRRAVMRTTSGFAVAAWVLALVGLLGVMTHAVRLRAREIGIRLALGAQSTDVVRLLLADGLRVVALGLAIGVVLALVAWRVAGTLLPSSTPVDAALAGGVLFAYLGVAAIACLAPAARAARVDPRDVVLERA